MKKTFFLLAVLFATTVAFAQMPVLGNYSAATIATASGNGINTPDVAPANTARILIISKIPA